MKQSRYGVGLASGSGSRPARDNPSTVVDELCARGTTAVKRKRLTKACDACHRSKRRCDGTAPCSNCQYTSKTCTYTDGQGRLVPAPLGTSDQSPSPSHQDSSGMYKSLAALQPLSLWDGLTIDDQSPRKRSRTSASETILGHPWVLPSPQISSPSVQLDNALTRELVGLFFTHCESARLIFHKPMFTAALTHGIVPPYLVFAMCALAAPLSMQPRLRTAPTRCAGRPFALEALSLMFDGAGRLTCEPSLAIAQALCLLQIHETRSGDVTVWNMRYHDLIIQVCDRLGVHSNEDTLRPVLGSTSAHIEGAINKECLRRVHWLVYLLDILLSVYARGSRQWLTTDPHLRLPCDETSFEMAVGTTPAEEYLNLPSSQTPNVSEMGHLIRVAKIWAELEFALEGMNLNTRKALVRNLDIRLKAWEASLPPHLCFSDEILVIKRSMLATSSSNDDWCWANMHMYRALCALLLHKAKVNEGMASSDATCADRSATQSISLTAAVPQEVQTGAYPESEHCDMVLAWPAKTLQEIVRMFGERAKSSFVLSTIMWFVIKHCRRDNGEFLEGMHDLETLWSACVEALTGSAAAASSTGMDDSSLDAVAPAPTPMTDNAHHDYDGNDNDTARRSTSRQGSLDPIMPFAMPPSPLQAHATPSDSTSIVQPSGLLGCIDRHWPSVSEKAALDFNKHMAPLSNSQPVESHAPSDHQYWGKILETRLRTTYSSPFRPPPRLLSPHNATGSQSQGQTFTGRRFELRSPSVRSQRPLSPLKLPEHGGIARSQRLVSQPSDTRCHLPSPLCASQNRRAYDEEDVTRLPRQKASPSNAYRRERLLPHSLPYTAPADPRTLPSLRSHGLVNEMWKDSGAYGSTSTADSPLPTLTIPLNPRQAIYRPHRAESSLSNPTGAAGIVTQLVGPGVHPTK